uniref:Uncharacterized protein n=1 Tax=Heterosigma akashiwo TaxID=2829 RepID=A0A6S9KZM3_HETAK|mmetsp:Transcript_42021/g.74407  ORF Transcript_42021/g.74407 Transcript_42021/m.74407 type:complete len:535 (+) Transcript_42021:90-1694(+)
MLTIIQQKGVTQLVVALFVIFLSSLQWLVHGFSASQTCRLPLLSRPTLVQMHESAGFIPADYDWKEENDNDWVEGKSTSRIEPSVNVLVKSFSFDVFQPASSFSSQEVLQQDQSGSNALRKERSDIEVHRAALAASVFGLSCVALVMCLMSFETRIAQSFSIPAIGYFSLAAAAIVTGGGSVPMKAPSLKKEEVDPWVFQLYASMGMAMLSSPLFLFLKMNGKFTFAPWALVGAAAFRSASCLSYLAIQKLGCTIAPAIWSGTAIFTSFFWGAGIFRECIRRPTQAVIALSLLVAGIVGVSASHDCCSTTDAVCPTPSTTNNSTEYDLLASTVANATPLPNLTQTSLNRKVATKSSLLGLLFCVACGILDGSAVAPLRLHEMTVGAADPLASTLNYVCNLGLGAMITTPALLLGHSVLAALWRQRAGQAIKAASGDAIDVKFSLLPRAALRAALVPGLLNGAMWGPRQLLTFVGMQYVGAAVGFPLTQLSIAVAAAWGVLYFQEVDPRSPRFRQRFPLGLGGILAGGALLACSK